MDLSTTPHATQIPPRDEKPFLFLNRYSKDPPGQRHEVDSSVVNKHVQHVIRRRKKRDTTKRLNPRGWNRRILPWRKVEVDTDFPSSISSSSAVVQPRNDSTRQSTSQAWSPEEQPPEYSKVSCDAPLSDILTSFSQAQMISTTSSLAFYMVTFVPRVYSVSSQSESHKQWVIQRAVTSPTLYFAMAAAGAAGVQALTIDSSWRTKISPGDATTLEMVAVRFLRMSIGNGDELEPSILIYSVMCLVVAQIINGDLNAIQVHARALSHFIRLHKALKAMPMYVVEGFISTCYISSMITGQPPLPPPIYDTNMTRVEAHLLLRQITSSLPYLADLGSTFFDPSIEAALGAKLIQLYRNMRAVIIWREYYHTQEEQCSSAEIVYFHNLSRKTRFLALNIPFAVAVEDMDNVAVKPRTQLASYPAPEYYKVAQVEEALREPCRITLLIFWNACNQVSKPGSLVYRTLAMQLAAALRRAVRNCSLLSFSEVWSQVDEQFQLMLLWILLIGALITLGEDDDDERFFLKNIAYYAHTASPGANLRNWRGVYNGLRRLLFLERVFGNSMEQCYLKAETFRPHGRP